MPLTIETTPSAEQTARNLSRWKEILADKELAELPHRIETDRHGHILMRPPPAPKHGKKQFRIGSLLEKHLPEGVIVTECPISTADGVKATDVAWLSPERAEEAESNTPFIKAPEICVEVFSPSNTASAIEEKRALYFGAGAKEVWICNENGKLKFYCQDLPDTPARSLLCPDFPNLIR
jgi:Uma2 family endonuclease